MQAIVCFDSKKTSPGDQPFQPTGGLQVKTQIKKEARVIWNPTVINKQSKTNTEKTDLYLVSALFAYISVVIDIVWLCFSIFQNYCEVISSTSKTLDSNAVWNLNPDGLFQTKQYWRDCVNTDRFDDHLLHGSHISFKSHSTMTMKSLHICYWSHISPLNVPLPLFHHHLREYQQTNTWFLRISWFLILVQVKSAKPSCKSAHDDIVDPF